MEEFIIEYQDFHLLKVYKDYTLKRAYKTRDVIQAYAFKGYWNGLLLQSGGVYVILI